MKKKKVLLKAFILFSMLIILLYVFMHIDNNYFFVSHEEVKIRKYELTYNKETDYSEVNYYMEGMSIKDFYLCYYKENGPYLEKTKDKYENINYNFDKHLKYSELEEIYGKLNKSDAVNIEQIGLTEDGRNMYSIEIGYGDKVLLIDGNIHAGEIAPTLFLTKFMIDILNDYESSNPSEKVLNLINNYKFVIVPSVNPDGYDYHLFGKEILNNKASFLYIDTNVDNFYYKANINGIDLNRSFPSEHAGLYYKSNDLSSTVVFEPSGETLNYYPGKVLASEKETRNMIYWFLKWYENSNGYISLHSSGRGVYNGKPNLSDGFNNLSQEYANVLKKYNNYKVYSISAEDIGYGNDGTSSDFYSELVSGFPFSIETGRLYNESYKTKNENLKVEAGAITIETLSRYTDNLSLIKKEWEEFKLSDVLIDLIELK